MAKTDNFVFLVLKIVAWIIFVGLCINAGLLLNNFILSIYNPDIVDKPYQKLDLKALYTESIYVFYGMYGFILSIAFSKAGLFYEVILLLMKMDLKNPFNAFVSNKITKIYWTGDCRQHGHNKSSNRESAFVLG